MPTNRRGPTSGSSRIKEFAKSMVFTLMGGLGEADSAGHRTIPLEIDAFTEAVAERFREALPEMGVHVAGPLHLRGTGPRGGWDSYLDSVHSICLRMPDSCDSVVAQHVAVIAGQARMASVEPQRSTLRVTVRPQSYIDGLAQAGRAEPLLRPLPGGFWELLAADLPTTIQTLGPGDATKLGLTPDAAFDLARDNMRREMQALLASLEKHPTDAIQFLSGAPYQSSLFAFPELWAPLAQSFSGDLLVSVVATDQIVFMPDGPGAAQALARAAALAAETAQRPFPPNLFRWQNGTWVVVPLPG